MKKWQKLSVIIFVLAAVGSAAYALIKDKQYQDSLIRTVEIRIPMAEHQKLRMRVDNFDEALLAARNDGERYDAHRDLADALFQLGRLDEARDAARSAVGLDHDKSSGLSLLFDIQVAMNDTKGAKKTIRTLLDNNPSHTYWRKYLGFAGSRLNLSRGDISQLYEEALAATDSDYRVMMDYARQLEEWGDNQQAKDYWVRVKAADPEYGAEYDLEIRRLDGQLNSQGQ